jgi:putative membrane protein
VVSGKPLKTIAMKNTTWILCLWVFCSMSNFAQVTSTGSSNGWTKDKVKDFVMEAANGGMMEVQLGKTAAGKASSPLVKEFGNTMVKDHSAANEKLKEAVKTLQIKLPSTIDKKETDMMDKLKNKTGKEFDKDYMDMMVSDHKKDVSAFETAQKNVTDPSLKAWIDNTLPVLRQHLTKALSTQKQLK